MTRESLTLLGTAVAAVAVCALRPIAAGAQEGPPGADGPMQESSEVLLGIGVANGPAYLGSDERKTRALPLIAARWSNGWFAGTGGIGIASTRARLCPGAHG